MSKNYSEDYQNPPKNHTWTLSHCMRRVMRSAAGRPSDPDKASSLSDGISAAGYLVPVIQFVKKTKCINT